jgi:biopolymer transport protein ExbD
MAEINENISKNKKSKKIRSIRLDMTPLVDLGFLLLTFFVLTSSFNKPHTMEIAMPIDCPECVSKVPADRTLNLILTNNDRIFWYIGNFDDAIFKPEMQETDFSAQGIRKLLIEKNKTIYNQIKQLESSYLSNNINQSVFDEELKKIKQQKDAQIYVLIKPDEQSRYKNIVDLLDEISICNISNYMLLEANTKEKNELALLIKE